MRSVCVRAHVPHASSMACMLCALGSVIIMPHALWLYLPHVCVRRLALLLALLLSPLLLRLHVPQV